jgi:hypothetical protein
MKKIIIMIAIAFAGSTAFAQFSQPFGSGSNPYTDSLSMPQQKIDTVTAEARPRPQQEEKIKLVKRTFDYKRQIGLALGMMAFVLIMMTATENLNPTARSSL